MYGLHYRFAGGRHYRRVDSQVVIEWWALPLGATCAAVTAVGERRRCGDEWQLQAQLRA